MVDCEDSEKIFEDRPIDELNNDAARLLRALKTKASSLTIQQF